MVVMMMTTTAKVSSINYQKVLGDLPTSDGSPLVKMMTMNSLHRAWEKCHLHNL